MTAGTHPVQHTIHPTVSVLPATHRGAVYPLQFVATWKTSTVGSPAAGCQAASPAYRAAGPSCRTIPRSVASGPPYLAPEGAMMRVRSTSSGKHTSVAVMPGGWGGVCEVVGSGAKGIRVGLGDGDDAAARGQGGQGTGGRRCRQQRGDTVWHRVGWHVITRCRDVHCYLLKPSTAHACYLHQVGITPQQHMFLQHPLAHTTPC
jgi:hypothetical protein